ncbi:MAG: YlxR family protein [Actinomycetales bacterium]|nr:YlxR family protein [Actinomycetales bacterium]
MEPVRTCVGCKQRANNLLRVVVISGNLTPDPQSKLAGRGARMHISSSCLKLAIERKAFGRALRTTGELRVDAVSEFVEEAEKMLAN